MEVIITRPTKKDKQALVELFATTISHTFQREGIPEEASDDLEREIQVQKELLDRDLASGGKAVYYLIARTEKKIVGTAAFGDADEEIRSNLDADLERTPEVKSVYILPDYQGRGVGSKLFQSILDELRRRDVGHYCLDSGYKASQAFWRKRLGEPTVVLRDRWAPGAHHMIWYREID